MNFPSFDQLIRKDADARFELAMRMAAKYGLEKELVLNW